MKGVKSLTSTQVLQAKIKTLKKRNSKADQDPANNNKPTITTETTSKKVQIKMAQTLN